MIIEDIETATATETSQHIKGIEQRGIRQFIESRVVVLSRLRTAWYLVLIGDQPCVLRNCPFTGTTTRDKSLVDEFIADMNHLLMSQGCSGVADFSGVVVNNERTQLRGYLVRYPEAGRFSELLETPVMPGGLPISWARREKWIRQIITAVAKIHQRGVAIGCPDKESMWIDLDDQIVIAMFRSTETYRSNREGQLPPEIRRLTAPSALPPAHTSTVQSDLFQLGLLIWRLAENDFNRYGGFCRRNGCRSLPHYRCMADHSNPVDLPPCSSEVPAYINEIIVHCRQEEPSRRRSACNLLAMLPADYEHSVFSPNRVSPFRPYCQRVYSNESGQMIDEHYACAICEEGDFELCLECISNSLWCWDTSHKLRRRVARNGRLFDEESISWERRSITRASEF